MRRFCVPAFVLAACCGSAQQHVVVSYNIRYDEAADGADRWELRKEAVADAVLAERPSLIGLQEALAHQLTYLDERWQGFRRFGAGREDGIDMGEFAPIYFDTTIYTFIEGRTYWLSETPDAPSKGWDAACERIATWTVLLDKRSGDSLWVVNTHWDHEGATARRESAALLLRILAPALSAQKAVLLIGDLNAEPGSEPICMLARSLSDACPRRARGEASFNGFEPDSEATKRIDYIWHSPRRWKRDDFRTMHPKVHGRQASDHFMLVARLRLTGR